MQQADLLTQLEQIRDALVDLADEFGLWTVVHAIDEVLERYDKYSRRGAADHERGRRPSPDGCTASSESSGPSFTTSRSHPIRVR